MKEIFIYNTKDMNNPGQIDGMYSKGAYKSKYYRIKFVRTGKVEYVNFCDVHFDVEKNLFYYNPVNVIENS